MAMLTIRPSMLPGFADCERRAVASAFPREIANAGYRLNPRRQSAAAAVGTGLHKGVESVLRWKIDHGELGNESEAVDIGVEAARVALTEGESFYDEVTTGPGDIPRQVQRMIKSYRMTIAPKLNPIFVETRLEVEFDGITVSGQTDVIAAEVNETVRDTKSGVKTRANQAQLGTYVAQRKAHGFNVGRVVEDFVPRVRLSKDQPPAETHEYDLLTAQWSAYTVLTRAVFAMMEFETRARTGEGGPPEYAFLANPMSMLCSPRWCPAHGTAFCKEHRT